MHKAAAHCRSVKGMQQAVQHVVAHIRAGRHLHGAGAFVNPQRSSPLFVVCTVLDKDGGSAVVTFPTDLSAEGHLHQWSAEDRTVVPDGGEESTAVYAAEFTDVSETNVTFVVTLFTGESLSYDTVTLQTSTSLLGEWETLKRYVVGSKTFPCTINLTPAGSGEVRFYRVVQP